MPCVSDYLEPDAREKEAGTLARLLEWLISDMGKRCPVCPSFIVGKCFQKAIKDGYVYHVSQATLDEWTETLCRIVRSFSGEDQDKYLYDGRNAKSRQLIEWWERHQKADERREKYRANAEKLANLQASALRKLTNAERRALGW